MQAEARRRVALVTGASSGIGRAEAVALARAGYAVVVNYGHNAEGAEETASLCRAEGVETLVVQCDVAGERSVMDMFQRIRERFGRLDVLCNNAGTTIKTPAAEFEQVTVEEWDHVMGVNVRGVFLVTKHAAELLRASDDACVVNTNSVVGARPGPQALPYSVSKGALWTMTKALAGALGPHGVRVNGVAPGWMQGEWMERMLEENYQGLMDRRARQTPLRRTVTPEDVAESVVSLIESNKSVTGAILVVDGGFTAVT
ncbi:MAG: SDR family oxidoreductase [Chloroflexi bacterium]|nr:SDR family oxidoreductase [Chloroflexota bacterium]